jgi:hypothetical protein
LRGRGPHEPVATVIGDRPSVQQAGNCLQMANQKRMLSSQTETKGPAEGRTVHHTINREVGMTRTDVMASSRPQAEGAANLSKGSSRGWRRLIVLPVLLLLAIAVAAPASAFAAETTTTNKEGLSGYEKKEEKKEEKGTSPEKEKKPAEKETPKSEPAPASSPEAAKSTLPFTGFDLRWTLAMGGLLVAAGLSIVAVQRRHRRPGGR